MTLKYTMGEVLNGKAQARQPNISVEGGQAPPLPEVPLRGGQSKGRGEDRGRRAPFNAQDIFLNQLRREKADVEFLLLSGEKVKGKIVGFDNFSIIIENTGQQLIYKHGVSLIVPLRHKGIGGAAQPEAPEAPATPPHGASHHGEGS